MSLIDSYYHATEVLFFFFFPRGCGGVPQEDGMTILPLIILIKKGFYKLMRIREAFKMSEHDWVRGSS